MIFKKKEQLVKNVALDLRRLREGVERERIANILTFFRLELLVPYIESSELAKKLGMSIDENVRLKRLVSSPADDLIFPGDEKLIALFDITREAAVERYSDEDSVLSFQKSGCVQEFVLNANWRTSCSRYLNAILEDPDKAADKYVGDETPWILHSALVSLSMYCFDEVPKDYIIQAANLVIAWKYIHEK